MNWLRRLFHTHTWYEQPNMITPVYECPCGAYTTKGPDEELTLEDTIW